MNTNINDIQDRYTAETVQYESSNIAAVLENLKASRDFDRDNHSF